MSIIADLRKLIHASGMSRSAIERESGVSVAVVSRLLSGERPDLTTATAERIAAAIGYELTFRPAGRGKRAKHGKAKQAT
ncbi:MAG: helix-turn-helix domain-containing protein [Phycisphaerales bacterium]|nr:helix-turn-helix domain-containing protein [Phycisphaerales bacterium]